MKTVIGSIEVFKKCFEFTIYRRDYENLPYREDLEFTPMEGNLYRAKGEPNTVFKFRNNHGKYHWDAFPVSLIGEK